VFAEGRIASAIDDRQDCGEVQIVTAGYLRDRFIVMVWAERDERRHLISIRHGHEREEKSGGANGSIPMMPPN